MHGSMESAEEEISKGVRSLCIIFKMEISIRDHVYILVSNFVSFLDPNKNECYFLNMSISHINIGVAPLDKTKDPLPIISN